MVATFPNARIEPRHEVVGDEHVVVAYTLTGTHQGEFQGIAPTGKRVAINGVQVGRFENGKLVVRRGPRAGASGG